MSAAAPRGSSAILERADDLLMLDETLAAVRASAEGSLVLVAGEAGVGKTALMRAFCDSQAASVRVLWGACEPLLTPRPLGPLFDVAQAAGGELEGPTASHVSFSNIAASPRLSFTLAAGDNAAPIKSIAVEPPRGIAFSHRTMKIITPAIAVTKALARKAKHNHVNKLRFVVKVNDSAKTTSKLTLEVTNVEVLALAESDPTSS